MKINGKDVKGPYFRHLVLPRPNGNLVFRFQAVLNFEEFDAIYPRPIPPTIQKPGEVTVVKTNDPKYLEELDKWARARSHWMFLKSISATEGLEWDTVNIKDPTTYENFEKDFANSGITSAEIMRLFREASIVSGLDSDKIEEATNDFLASLRQESET